MPLPFAYRVLCNLCLAAVVIALFHFRKGIMGFMKLSLLTSILASSYVRGAYLLGA